MAATRATRSRGARLDRRTRAARAQNREAREELLAAALRVFAERGYSAAGVDDIAAAAGYSKGALYWHFASKQELLSALLQERLDTPLLTVIALLQSAPVDRDMSEEGTREFARQLSSQRDALVLEREYWILAIRDPELRVRYLERQTQLREALAAGLQARARRLGAPESPLPLDDLARVVMAIVGGLAVDELIEPGSVRFELVGETLALIYAGLVARGSG